MMKTLAIVLLFSSVAAAAPFTQPLATGVRLDPAGAAIDLGSMPIGMALAPGGRYLAVVLSGFREQGLQIVDLETRKVTQTLLQTAAFYGVAFSPDGKHVYVSGGNDDSVFCYAWTNGTATLERKIVLGKPKEDKTGSSYPAGIAVSRNGRYLYVAENVGDSVAVVDLESQNIESPNIDRLSTDHFPYAVEMAADGNVYVSAWGADTVSVFGARANGTLFHRTRIEVGRHPSALVSNRSGSRLYVGLGGSDRIAVVDTSKKRVTKTLHDPAPNASPEGSTPNALALSPDGATLYAAEGDNNAVAVFDATAGTLKGRIPADWYPTAIVSTSSQLLVLSGKGHGSHANPDGPVPGKKLEPLGYDLGQLNGTLRITAAKDNAKSLPAYTSRVAAANNWNVKRSVRPYPPFKHVIYVIKENRTYDQIFGDLKEGDGDPSLVFFDHKSTPNHRALALRFGLFDRFFTNAEVSSQGHTWSTAAYVTDYDEKIVPSEYSDRRAGIGDDEAIEPESGFLWTLTKKAGVSFRDYGEIIIDPKKRGPETPDLSAVCKKYPVGDLTISDQKRADVWIDELKEFVADGNMPSLELVYLPLDHTAGGRAGMRTPSAYMADNDLGLGRIVDALSHSRYWKDTVMFVLEDDSQAGPDHVDSHRGPLLVISAYNRPGTIHRFANTTDVIGAIEDILKLGRLSKYDSYSRSLADVFTASTPDLQPYTAIMPEADREALNPPKTATSELSKDFDLTGPDRINDALFNKVLWAMLKPDQPMPRPESRAAVHLLEITR
jgi:DNA-binding beta-propeller fold protein YncE